MNKVLYPEAAKDEQDVLRKIETWQADCEEADLKGLTKMGPEQKIAILKRIVTTRWRERIDVRLSLIHI